MSPSPANMSSPPGEERTDTNGRTPRRLQVQPALLRARLERWLWPGGVPERFPRQQQLPRRRRPRARLRRRAGGVRLWRLPRLPRGARPQLHPPLAVGAHQVADPVRRGAPVHVPAAVGPDGAGQRGGRQAQVRPVPPRPGVLRPASQPGGGRRGPRHLRLGDVVRRVRPPPHPVLPLDPRVQALH